ncbi:MAG TPA: NAD-dependent epimerase/dehydratase family protein [Terrimicrobiaceae bacterium]|nr:NAD-dependent epimerase/dehydratase family protein [Terrimicrobiaceae bacterium]
MRILITGGAGCLGSNLIDRLLPQGHEIHAVDNFATGKRGNLPEVPGLTVTEGTIADPAVVETAFAAFQPEVVIHSAAAYKDPANWAEDAASNVLGSIHVAKAAEKHGARSIIHFQTALCYGRPAKVPISVDQPTRPFTSYGISKTAGEQFLMMSSVPVVSLRLANITGPRLAIGPIPTFYKRLKAGQKCFCSETVRDFLDMDDFLSLMELLLARPETRGIFNVSSGEGRSIKDVFDAVAAYLNITPAEDVPLVPPGDDDVPAVVLDPAATKEQLGWEARIGFTDTINRMLAWYDQYGVTDVFSHLAAPKS